MAFRLQTMPWKWPRVRDQDDATVSTGVRSWFNWTPASIPNVIAWWDASDDSTFTFSSGTSVSQWNSKIGSYALTQATGTKQPSRSGIVNGLSSVVFDGNSDAMSVASFDLSPGQEFSIWVVGFGSSGGDQIILEQTVNYNNTPGAFVVAKDNANTITGSKKGGLSDYATFTTTGTFITVAKIAVFTHNGALTTNETSGWLNLSTSGTRAGNANTANSNINNTLFVGARNTSSLYLNGQLCEFGFANLAMTQNQIQVLSQYLRSKWAIQF